jgi:hypothetical protein
MIHEAFTISEIARRYYLKKTGENLDKETARKRWNMTRITDLTVLNKVFADIFKEQKKMLKKKAKMLKKKAN